MWMVRLLYTYVLNSAMFKLEKTNTTCLMLKHNNCPICYCAICAHFQHFILIIFVRYSLSVCVVFILFMFYTCPVFFFVLFVSSLLYIINSILNKFVL